jgi:F0F1-type ATP synthase membrane subunit c/vacuolar-type H+-ATPase subunit K
MQEHASTPSSPYVLSVCTDMSVWDALVKESPQGHVFSRSAFLQSLGAQHACYVVATPQGEVLAGAALMLDGDRMARAPFAFTPHQGILFAKSVSLLGHQKRLTSEFRITTFLIEALLDVYPNFSMALSPFFKDLRPFLWHNYSKVALPQFDVRQRYTGHLSLIDFELDSYLASVRTVRRQEYKKMQTAIQQSDDVSLFLKLYQQTFDRQGLAIESQTLTLVENICVRAMADGYGHLSSAHVDGRVASMAFFVTDAACAYYLFGANDPDMRDARASSKLLIDNISVFAARGFERFDFVGVNSPQRGDFKLSFNAELVPYQEVHLQAHA